MTSISGMMYDAIYTLFIAKKTNKCIRQKRKQKQQQKCISLSLDVCERKNSIDDLIYL
jgi:hypothetical protein